MPILLSAACFGVMPLFARLAYASGADMQAVLLSRFLIASICLVGIMLIRREIWPRGWLVLGLLGMGTVGYAGQAFSYFSALKYASASLTAQLLYTYPVIVTLIAAVWLKEPLTRRKLVALVLASIGLALTVGDALSGSPIGIAFGLTAALIYSIYIVVGTKLTPQAGALASTTLVMLGGLLTYGVVAVVQPPTMPQTGLGWLAILALGLLCSVLAALAFFAGLARLGASEAAMLSTFEPVVTVLLAAWLLGERLSFSQWGGGAVIIVAVLLLAKSPAHGTPPE
ncbi:DMT family transporter [Chitinimonas sp. BJB300]|uniref:DMT family transporter n=1 Tax=Chitinimonas sp. BJB300 TaxID=1559339 RepID=UPI000C11B0EE|nr:DMT family transporter [Chitinimonas sp. BJB300]PHV10695.1 EamA family transporter [Chitinimonas sp. BJB300]TSJ91632.1 DMT family transporter [Chitinimonas sp. BJB300]